MHYHGLAFLLVPLSKHKSGQPYADKHIFSNASTVFVGKK